MGKSRNVSIYSTIQTSNKQFTGRDLAWIVSEFPEAVNSKKKPCLCVDINMPFSILHPLLMNRKLYVNLQCL